MRVAVLTYHSNNVFGTGYGENDHVSLAADVRALHQAGATFASLDEIVDAVRAGAVRERGRLVVGISFDDGPIFDYHDFEHWKFGFQRSFRNILDDFSAERGVAPIPATSFVIASPGARAAMERADDYALRSPPGWLSDEWWPLAARSGRHAIGNHSWDHVHHATPNVALSCAERDDFTLVRTYPDADAQIRRAAEFISQKIGGGCRLFAYPFGHVSEYLALDYLPQREYEHGMRAAFAVARCMVPPDCSAWNIPRIVCGLHWKSVRELLDLVGLATGACPRRAPCKSEDEVNELRRVLHVHERERE